MSIGSNSFGHLFRWTSFGESHGPAMGVVIDGCPAGVTFDQKLLLDKLSRRRPGGPLASQRQEEDQPEILSGIFQGKTLGTPISVIVRNKDQRSQDYKAIQNSPRIGHADDTWLEKFGHSDYRGGGRASARETLNWVIAGSFAQMFCCELYAEVKVTAHIESVGEYQVESLEDEFLSETLQKARETGESFGAVIGLIINQVPPNLGEPVFKKIKSQLASALMGLNASCGVEVGGGFELAKKRGSEVHTTSDSPEYGGIRGGITTGDPIYCRLAVKPTASILDTAKKGRHDPCVAIRALPIVEALAWSIIADNILMQRLSRVETL